MSQITKLKKIFSLPTVLILFLTCTVAMPSLLTIISNFTNWTVFDTSNGYGYGYGYGYNGYTYQYGYGYGYNSGAIVHPHSGGGAGIGSLIRDNSPESENIDNTIDQDATAESFDNFSEGHGNLPKGNVENSPFSDETNSAYQYAYAFGITSMGDVVSAKPEEGTTRAQLAKMMVQFASKALGKTMDTTRVSMCSKYTDVDASLGDLKDFITVACASKIMGLEVDENTPLQAFDPNKIVTRGEIATVLGRLIFGNAYKDMDPYYIGYMTALYNAGIITVNDPSVLDIRANIWIMLERAHKWLAGK